MGTTKEKERRLAECFDRGQHLAHIEKNYDYAHAMFTQCLGEAPGNIAYAEALIANLKARFGNDKTRARHLWRLPGERELRHAIAAEKWADVLRLGLDVLKGDPWHVLTLRSMARACAAQHFNEVELVYLKQALDASPKDLEVNRHCAHSLARMGQFDQAIACWHRVEEITGGSPEAARMISQLAQDKIRFATQQAKDMCVQKGRVAVDTTNSAAEEEPQHSQTSPHVDSCQEAVHLMPRQRFEKAIQDEPAEVSNYLALSRLFCEMGDYVRAESTLTQALSLCAQTGLVRNALEQVKTEHGQAIRMARELEREKERRSQRKPLRIPWLELALLSAGVLLLLQLVPSWWETVSGILFVHSQVILFIVNLIVVVLLIAWRQWKQ